MKSRRLAIVAFLLIACTVIGIGYAAMSKELTVSGGLHAGPRSNLEVWFTDADVDDTVDNNLCTVASLVADQGAQKALTANMETGTLTNVGDTAVAIFKISSLELASNSTHAKIYDPSMTLLGANSGFTNPEDFYNVTFEFIDDPANAALNDDEHAVSIGTDDAGKPVVKDLPPQHSVLLKVTVTLKTSVTSESVNHAATFTLTYTAEAIQATH